MAAIKGVHSNDEPILRDMLGMPSKLPLPPELVGKYERIRQYMFLGHCTASLNGKREILALIADWYVEKYGAWKAPPEPAVADKKADAQKRELAKA